MTERENLEEVFRHSGKAQWIPNANDSCFTIIPSAVHDRPPAAAHVSASGGSVKKTEKVGTDWFGCKWFYDEDVHGFSMNPSDALVIEDLTEWKEHLILPDLDAIDWETCAAEDLKEYNREEKMLRIFTESGSFERLHQLHGFSETMVDMYEEPEAVMEIMDILTDFRIRLIDKICTYYKPDIILTMNDLGANKGPFMSKELYRKFIKPFDERVFKTIKDHGAYVLFHSCGCMYEFLDDLVEIGADAIHPLQGGINDQTAAEKLFGDRLVFFDCLDNNVIHARPWSKQDVGKEVIRLMDLFGEKKNYVLESSALLKEEADYIIEVGRNYNVQKAEKQIS